MYSCWICNIVIDIDSDINPNYIYVNGFGSLDLCDECSCKITKHCDECHQNGIVVNIKNNICDECLAIHPNN